jgi:nitrite reductase/ring-hydroxylating ferredoxin subunit
MSDGVGWVPVALSVDVPAGAACPAVVDDAEIVVWRTASGRVQVWVDRCPHRGMRFSFGFVRGEEIACLYHGWQFAADGGCTRIPAHPDLTPPATICSDAYPSREADGLVWFWPERGATPDAPPPSLAGLAPVRSLTVRAPAGMVLAALGGTADGPLVRTEAGGRPLVAAVQRKNDCITTLHLLAADPADRPALAGWSEAFRRRVEATAADVASAA